jgi:hypothetical protein
MNREFPVPPAAARDVYLLPGFDEYLLGYRDRSAVLEPRDNGPFLPTIVINGRVVGTWKRVLKKNEVLITPNPFTPLKKADRNAFAAAAERYRHFVAASNFSLDFRV